MQQYNNKVINNNYSNMIIIKAIMAMILTEIRLALEHSNSLIKMIKTFLNSELLRELQ